VSLLSLEDVSKRYRRGNREYVALRGVSLEIDRAEEVVVLGARKSGRSTLLRIAAGLEPPDVGRVCFDGAPLSAARDLADREISYCHRSFWPMEGERVLDHVAIAPLCRGASLVQARRAAASLLDRVGAGDCAAMRPDELTVPERVRVAVARSLAKNPSLLVIDDPTEGAGTLPGSGILRLLRSIASDGVTVLMSTSDPTSVSGADRVVSLDAGRLRADVQAAPAEVVPLRPRGVEPMPGARLG
jgi:ABC-type lipoprotein export system ATPase subunit